MPLHVLIGIGAIMIIVCLVVRDRTEYRIEKLKRELRALLMDEKRQADMRKDIEQNVAQASEALLRADRRNNSMRRGCDVAAALLDQLEEFEEEGVPMRRRDFDLDGLSPEEDVEIEDDQTEVPEV